MAQRSFLNPLQKVASNGSLVNIGMMNDPTIPEGYQDRMAQLYQTAVRDYNSGSFHARHPKVSAGLNAALGALTLNPVNMVTYPLMGNQQEAKRKNSIAESYQNAIKTMAYQQNQLNDTQQATSRGHVLNNLLSNAGYQSPAEDYSQLDATTVKNILDGVMAGDTAQGAMTAQEGSFKRGWNIGGRMYNSMQGGVNPPVGQQGQPSEQPGAYLAASAMETAPAPALRPAIYQNPDIAKAGVDNSAKLFEAGVKTFPDYAKLPAEIAKLVSEGRADEALTLLRQAQTTTEQQRPALIQAEASANQSLSSLRDRTDPNARGLNVIDLMSPQQRQQYAATTAANGAGKGADFSPEQARLEFQLQSIINSPTDANGKAIPPETKAAAQAALARLQSNNRSRSLQARPSAPSSNAPSIHGIRIE